MSMQKAGYINAARGTTKVKVNVNEDGNIAQRGEAVAGVKSFAISAANAENGLVQNTQLLDFFIGLVGGTADANTNKMIVTWEVA